MLKIVGDINFSDGYFDTGIGIGSSIARGEDPFKYLNRDVSDFWIGNFECVCADSSNNTGLYAKQFIISPEKMEHIEHLDLYGVANNHVMQHGDDSYREMLHYLSNKGILYVGSKDCKCVKFEHQGKNIGVIAFCQRSDNFTDKPLYWSLPEYHDVCAEIQKMRDCDFKIVYVHWGIEYMNKPYNDQIQFAHSLIDGGADMIIGMHPHCLQGYEKYKNKYIFYSLGNFVFNKSYEPTKYSIIVNVDFSEEGTPKVTFDTIYIGPDYFPRYTKEIPDKYSMDYLNSIISYVDNEKYFTTAAKQFKLYRNSNRMDIVKNLYSMGFRNIIQIVSDFIKRKLK